MIAVENVLPPSVIHILQRHNASKLSCLYIQCARHVKDRKINFAALLLSLPIQHLHQQENIHQPLFLTWDEAGLGKEEKKKALIRGLSRVGLIFSALFLHRCFKGSLTSAYTGAEIVAL